jgi:4-aminobutyrate aminotransferase/(S)-3-amino-2-methylpropionate transaminase
LCQAGGDAVTAALKTATLATGRNKIIAFDGAYHGLGYAPLAACGFQAAFREPFEAQLSRQVAFAPYPGVRNATAASALDFVTQLSQAGDVAAILVEPILGRGGCIVPPDGFLKRLAAIAHQHGSLLIVDEILTGLGRAGSMVRSAADGANADIVCFGKGLGGGLSISACLAPRAIMAAWSQGGQVVHTSTHAGLPLACATALATLDTLDREALVERASAIGARFREALRASLDGCEEVSEVRGEGLLVGVELTSPERAQRLVGALRKDGFLVITGGVAGDTLTLTPALTIDEEKLQGFVQSLTTILGSTDKHRD